MNQYKGLFTFDVDNHRYVPVEQADGLISDMNYNPEPKEEPKGSALDLMILTLTNFIENEPDEDKVNLEDCKQMLEKLLAWKRLKDKGVRFDECRPEYQRFEIYYVIPERPVKEYDQIFADIYFLFGGEE